MKKAFKSPTKTQLRTATNQSRELLSEWIRTTRTKQNLSQEGLAEIAGVDRKTINRIENGHFSPSIETLVRISLSLDSKIPSLV
ncbi:COG1476 Predicted transcriptional regulators [uncultured Caudovirales phage]|jgi:transcriptional regulator with XRE-family HTH domain|uniref:COG1476 Predicted transcriptional regulators n=1 Tax=uncultured Caudovirales phage TaxID=2100421 RepID=A0A6J5SGV8_9CAUD|nr:COG1476 Predicted transcriptional regulators [uncultured Caudovirales phage]CAB4155912.1 COG1476 Predicted transcriptional regulators [uncultured Caudovirales phage]CAB4160259.1 COG1476 Predicted transcriptional regulators [uncultured Caudovirales phage]CAB4164686.1 COG1476 Predicted transcriptional regulators [uncultured Caudovirales phage]CAB4171941.1 COG1476 Predicted transcriptional regulators [uncultured Caudovirales phage]